MEEDEVRAAVQAFLDEHNPGDRIWLVYPFMKGDGSTERPLTPDQRSEHWPPDPAIDLSHCWVVDTGRTMHFGYVPGPNLILYSALERRVVFYGRGPGD